MIELPTGFSSFVTSLGVRDGWQGHVETDDFTLIAADHPVAAAGMFTRSRFAGPSVTLSREHLADRTAQAIVVVSKNANVANGRAGDEDNRALVAAVADRLGCRASDVVIASTGVIGRRYPIERMLARLDDALPAQPAGSDLDGPARAMMTTDTHPKLASATVGDGPAQVVGMAKGSGMIEPRMATMIAVMLTDAEVSGDELDARFRAVVDRTFNCVSVDTDSSTSDTAVVLASGAAGPVSGDALEVALGEVALSLAKQIARDGEGATKLLEVTVDGARDGAQAKRIAKAIVNSPLVKTAVHGADPNWGRVAMAIGKCDGDEDADIDPGRVVIRFGDRETYPTPLDDAELNELAANLKGDEVRIHVSLGTGAEACTVWGCDLTAGYIRINADYTT